MAAARTQAFRAAFAALRAGGLNRGLRARAQGLGVILTLHHVRPWRAREFAPNRLLEIEPAFLDQALARARKLGFDFVSLDEAWRRTLTGVSYRPFLHVTFDDGYRDVRDHALPILERHGAPATLFVTSRFAEHDAGIWWLELEEAIVRSRRIYMDLGRGEAVLPTESDRQKQAAWNAVYWRLRSGSEENLRAEVRRLGRAAGVDPLSFARELCMDWSELKEVARHPLIAIGAHTVTHPMLAKHPDDVARAEMADSREAIRRKLGLEAAHFAYPVGDRSAASPRDYALAAELGFTTAVTTRPGHIHRSHAATPTALPRVSLNGHFQTAAALDALLAGTPFLLMRMLKRGRG